MHLIPKTIIFILIFSHVQNVMGGWVSQSAGTLSWLHSIYFIDEKTGWIVGSAGTVLTTKDGGLSWAIAKKFTADNIRDVHFRDHKNGWLICERDMKGNISDSPSYLMRTADGGEKWEKIHFPDNRDRLSRIFFRNSGDAFGIGEGGMIWRNQLNKSEWKKTALPVRSLMLDGSFASDLMGALVGGGGKILYTDDGGDNWNVATLADNAKPKFNAVYFSDASKGWAVGSSGKIYFTESAGKFWRGQESETVVDLTDVQFDGDLKGFAVGERGTILRTTTGGRTWQQETSLVRHRLESVWITGSRAFAVGFGGTLLTYAED